MNNTLKKLTVSALFALFSAGAAATGSGHHNKKSDNDHSHHNTVQNGGTTLQNDNDVSQTQGQSQVQSQTATGGTADASASSTSSSTGGNVGDVSNHQQNVTNNNYRAFGSTNAPGMSGAVNNCMAVTGNSVGFNVMNNGAVGLGFGKQKAEYNEKCASVSVGTSVYATAGGDPQKEALGLGILSEALPGQLPQAIEKTVERVNAYAGKNKNAAPSSVLEFFGASALNKKTEQKRVTAAVVKKPAVKKPDCDCGPATQK